MNEFVWRKLAACVCCLCLIGSASVSETQEEGETRALLIGVSDYYHLDADLRGPLNDVALMAQGLAARGISAQNMVVLSEGIKDLPQARQGKPTRAAILAAMSDLREASAPGDTILFYFSGHGSQMPDTSGDEQGGHDQIFLPADARNWTAALGAVENAILDDELRMWAKSVLDREVKLVAIIDACHSGTGFRALGETTAQARYIAPEALGVPSIGDVDEVAPDVTASPLNGEFVFLYSSQSDQRSFEYPLDDAEDPANWYGDFTRNLVNVLQQSGEMSYGQWLQATRDGMRKASATATQTPDGEGSLLDAAVLGVASTGVQRIVIRDGQLQLGALSDVLPGAVYALYDDAIDGIEIGRAEVSKVQPTQSRLIGLEGATVPVAGYAELLSPGPPAVMTLSRPRAPNDFDGYDYRPLTEALDQLHEDDLLDAVALSDDAFDASLILMDGRLVLAGPDGIVDAAGLGTSPRFAPTSDGDLGEDLAQWLSRLARVYRLSSALNSAGRGGFALAGTGMTVKLERRPSAAKDDACVKPATSEKIGDGALLNHCDQVWVHLSNLSNSAQDVTLLYVDRHFEIQPIWPSANLSNRIAPGGKKKIGMQIVNPAGPEMPFAVGHEELIVLSVPVDSTAPRVVLTSLAETGQTRAADATPLEQFLGVSLEPDSASRALSLSGALAPLKVNRFTFEVHPQQFDTSE